MGTAPFILYASFQQKSLHKYRNTAIALPRQYDWFTKGRFFVAYQNLPGRCLVRKHGSHVINIPKADWSSVKNKQLTATPCWVLVGDEKQA